MPDAPDYEGMSLEELEALAQSYAEELTAIQTKRRCLARVIEKKTVAARETNSNDNGPAQVLEAFQIESDETVDGMG
jgi:hypothetical protein